MGLINNYQREAIYEFRNALLEVLDDINDSAFELESVETCMEAVIEAWNQLKDLFSDDEDEDEDDESC